MATVAAVPAAVIETVNSLVVASYETAPAVPVNAFTVGAAGA